MKKSTLIGVLTCAAALASSGTAMAAVATQVVTEADVARQAEDTPPTKSWVLYTRAGTPATAGIFREGPGAPPLGTGSFGTSTATGAEKVQLFNFDHVGTKLGDVDRIAYSTYRTAGTGNQLPALNLVIDFNGPAVAGGFSTLVFEPVYNLDQQPVVDGTWQSWTATGSGVWWSTKPINGQCAGATDFCDKTWQEIVANNPDATVLGGAGVNQGSGNAGLTAATDAFTFDETTYDFEQNVKPRSKDDCKKGGYASYTTGTPPQPAFKNQGECVSSFGGDAKKP